MALKLSPFTVRVEEIPETGISFSLTMNDILPRSTVDWDTSQADDFRTRGG